MQLCNRGSCRIPRCLRDTQTPNFAKYPFPHSKFADYQSPHRNIGVRLSLLSTVKTSANIAPVRETENSESNSDDAHLQLLQTFLAIKRHHHHQFIRHLPVIKQTITQ